MAIAYLKATYRPGYTIWVIREEDPSFLVKFLCNECFWIVPGTVEI